MIELKELEFTAEDFGHLTEHPGDEPNLASDTARVANRILKEKLSRAPLHTWEIPKVLSNGATTWAGENTHMALLVCTREIPK